MSAIELLQPFFSNPGVTRATYREWSDGGIRAWFKLQRSKTAQELRDLLETLPEGAWIQFFDVDYPPVSDTGAFVQVTRRSSDEWSIAWNNYGWGSDHFPVTIEDAALYMSRCYETDWDAMMAKKATTPKLMLHLTTLENIRQVCHDQQMSERDYFTSRLAGSLP